MTSPEVPTTLPITAEAPFATWHGHMANDMSNTCGPKPEAMLQAGPEHILISGPLGVFRIPRRSIRKITRGGYYPWFFRGLRLHHAEPGVPEHLQFLPLRESSRGILNQLKSLGY